MRQLLEMINSGKSGREIITILIIYVNIGFSGSVRRKLSNQTQWMLTYKQFQ